MKKILLTLISILFIFPTIINGEVLDYTRIGNKVVFKLDKGQMRLTICSDKIIHTEYTILKQFSSKKSLVITNDFKKPIKYKIKEKANDILIQTKLLSVYINKIDNSVIYKNKKGEIILAEDGINGKVMQRDTIDYIKTYNCKTRFLSPKDEAIYGLGNHPEDSGSMNYKGRNQELLIKYLTGAVPVIISTKGYGLLFDNYSISNFHGALADNTKYEYESESGRQIDYYFMYGPNFDEIIREYRNTTGQAPLYPKWSYGLFQCRNRYKTQKEFLSIKNGYRENKIPLDCIVMDWHHWTLIGAMDMQKENYPDPKKMIEEVHKANLHAMITLWPVYNFGTDNYEQMMDAGNLLPIHSFNKLDNYYDAYKPSAREMFWDQAYKGMIEKYDWDAIWVDQCEPWNGEGKYDIGLRRTMRTYAGRGIDYFNSYSLVHSQGLYDHWRRDIKNKRAFLLTRQTFAGQQRTGAALWSGDIQSTWKAYKEQIPQGLNTCASGIPYWTSDIGGWYDFKVDWTTKENTELYERWLQYGAFCPLFRIHGSVPRELYLDMWSDETKKIFLGIDNLRYRLMPYIYSNAWEVTHSGYTMMRNLSFDYRNDNNVYNIQDQYLFGPSLMVCPVIEYGARKRNVYFPKGEWYDFFTGKLIEGGKDLEVNAPIEHIPLFVKAGSIIPMGPFEQYATEKSSPVELRIYPGQDATFTYYEDENDNYNYENGKYATFEIKWNDKKKQVSFSDTKGSYKGMSQNIKFKIVIVSENQGIGVKNTIGEIINYKRKTMKYIISK